MPGGRTVGLKALVSKPFLLLASCLPLLLIAGCRRAEPPDAPADKFSLNSCKAALAAHNGEAHIDRDIQKMQKAIRAAREPEVKVERLGWLFVSKARSSHDDGYYKLAELCAACLQKQQPDSAAALLLRGHVLHSLHRFQEAETIARQLVKIRRVPFGGPQAQPAVLQQSGSLALAQRGRRRRHANHGDGCTGGNSS